MRFFGLFICALAAIAACGPPSPLSELEPGERGRVVRIIDGDALALNTGQNVRLIGIEAPALRPRGREPDSWAVESARALEDLTLGRNIQLYYSGITRDRYDRALAHIVTTDQSGAKLWINMELVKRGAARVRLYADTAAYADDLLAVEATARADNIGLWAESAYKVRDITRLPSDHRGFTLVEATLGAVLPPDARPENQRPRACERALNGTQYRLVVAPQAAAICDAASGQSYRLRGWVSGGRMTLDLIEHAEPL